MNRLPTFGLLILVLSSVACAAHVDDAAPGAEPGEPAAPEVVASSDAQQSYPVEEVHHGGEKPSKDARLTSAETAEFGSLEQQLVAADARRALGAASRGGPTWDELLSCVPCAAARYEVVIPHARAAK